MCSQELCSCFIGLAVGIESYSTGSILKALSMLLAMRHKYAISGNVSAYLFLMDGISERMLLNISSVRHREAIIQVVQLLPNLIN